ncbi:2-phosphosulfolactate phosphatase [Candidatus Sumerlaeota bacterium]|nr:2-phosphosulfolactate phosphatase [Candidatus Sumerlaeota bacterium]
MKISCALSPKMIVQQGLAGQVAVMIDVLRASTVIITALSNGSKWVYPVRTRNQAIQAKEQFISENPLLAGERLGVKIPGFDLGNSPLEFVREKVNNRGIIMTTTNGTAAIVQLRKARRVVVGSFINVSAVVELVKNTEDLLLVCAGTKQKVALEDTACAGAIIDRLLSLGKSPILTDSATIARLVYLHYKDNLLAMMREVSEHGRRLIQLGFEKDIEYAARVDSTTVIPVVETPGYLLKKFKRH